MPSPDSATYLHAMCNLPLPTCRKALADNGNDPELALLALVKSEAVSPRKLNAEATPPGLYNRAKEVFEDHFKSTTIRAVAKAFQSSTLPDPRAEQAALRLKEMSTFDLDVCLILLKKHDYDPERALARMIDDRFVLLRHLDPAIIPPALYARARDRAAPSELTGRPSPAAATSQAPVSPLHLTHETLTLRAFPTLTLDPITLEGHDVFPSWAGFQNRQGPYAARSTLEPSNGRAIISFHLPDDNVNTLPAQPRTPCDEQLVSYAHFKAHEQQITADVLQAIIDKVPEWRKVYGPDLPPIHTIADLKPLIGLSTVHVHSVAKDGHAYLGFEIGCAWDVEHAIGVLTHLSRILETSSADASFDTSTPLADGGRPLTS